MGGGHEDGTGDLTVEDQTQTKPWISTHIHTPVYIYMHYTYMHIHAYMHIHIQTYYLDGVQFSIHNTPHAHSTSTQAYSVLKKYLYLLEFCGWVLNPEPQPVS